MIGCVKRPDAIAGIALLALGIYIYKAATHWSFYGVEGPGPGFFPAIYGTIMALFAVVLLVGAFKKSSESAEPASEPAAASGTMAALAAWGALALSVPLMWILGFVVGFALVLFFIVRVVFEKPVITAAVTAVAIVTTLYVGFSVLLETALPTGMFWGF